MILVPVDYNPFEGPTIQKMVPLTESQLEIWLSCMLGGDDANRAYNESVSISLKGKFHFQAFHKAIEELIVRHEALRSTISPDGKTSCIYAECPLYLEIVDIRANDETYQKAKVSQYHKSQAFQSYDLVSGPLFRTALFQLSNEEHVFIFNIHHIIGDGWSLGVLLQDLSVLYNHFAFQSELKLSAAPSFASYAIHQQKFQFTEAFKKTESYWLEKFQKSVPVLNIPTDYPRPTSRTYKSHRIDFEVDKNMIESLKKLGSQAGCSFVTTLICVFEVYVHQLCNQKEIVIGLPAAAQANNGLEGLVGHCVNMLPIRSIQQPEASFLQYLTKRKAQILDDYEHQDYTFGRLLKKLNIARDSSRIPLMPLVLNIDLGLDNGVVFQELPHKLLYNPREFESFEIFLNVAGSVNEVLFEWSYNTQIFKAETIEQMMASFLGFINKVIDKPEIIISDLSKKKNHIAQYSSKTRNLTQVSYTKNKSFPVLFRERAKSIPDKTAVVFQEGEYTYGQLEHDSNALATYLQRMSIHSGHIVAIALPRSYEMIVALLAVMKSGAAYLPIDPEYPNARITYFLENSKAEILITNHALANEIKSKIKTIYLDDIWSKLDEITNLNPIISTIHSQLAYLLYTSGSTGNPKGVMIEHGSLLNLLYSMASKPGMTNADSMLSVTTISFDIAALELFLPLLVGGTLILANEESAKDGRLLLDLLESKKPSIMQATPATWRMLVSAGWQKPMNLKVLCGGEAFPKNLAADLLQRATEVWNVYGPTETTIWSLIHQLKGGEEIFPIGLPIHNTSVFLLDEYLQEVPDGEVGEIYIGGHGLARGYLNQPALTDLKFIVSPFPETYSGKLYRTGDLGKVLEDGNIQCLGRIDNQVKIRGYRIEPAEIEIALIKLAGVKESVVLALNDRLLAYLVGNTAFYAQWRLELEAVLPAYMIPNDFIVLPKFPITPNGKTDRLAIAQMAQDKSGLADYYVPAVTPAQVLVAKIWQEVLGLEQISIQSNFFELGGHSLLAIQIMTAIEKETKKRYPLALLFEAPTIQKLAAVITSENKVLHDDCLVPMKPNGSKPALYFVHGYDLNIINFSSVARNMDIEQPVFGLQAMGLSGKKDPYTSMEEIAAHYIAEIINQNPSGPYALAGYSFGGVIAYEMTRQLESMGKKVIMLAMLDSYAENADYFYPKSKKLAIKLQRQFPKFLYITKSLFKNPYSTLKYQAEYVERRVGEFLKSFEKQEVSLSDKINAAYETAYKTYKMVKYDGLIDVFRVKTRLYYLPDRVYMGWLPFAKKGVEIHEIEGDHKTFLTPPRDKEFAKVLQKVLDERASKES